MDGARLGARRPLPHLGLGAPTVLFEEANSAPGRIVSDGKRLYFILQTGGRVVSCPVDGPCDAPVVVMRGLVDPQRLAFAGGYVVVADNGAGKVLAAPK